MLGLTSLMIGNPLRKDIIGGTMENRRIMKHIYINGVICGVISALITISGIISSWYIVYPSAVDYFIGLTLFLINYQLLKQNLIKNFILAWGISVIINIILEVIFAKTGLLHMVYYNIYPDSGRMSAGTGFAIIVLALFYFGFSLLGSIAAFIKTFVAQRKAKRSQGI